LRNATTHTTNQLHAFSAYRFHFNGQEADNEVAGTGNSYTAEFWQYDSRLGRRWNLDPVVKPHESPYTCYANNPIWFIDPNGADTLDIIKNDDGKWTISKTQIVKGDDVFRVNNGRGTKTYTFSEGEYGKRINVLNLENNEDYTLSIFHISGAIEGGTGYAITPGGDASAKQGSNKRLPSDVYTLGQSGKGAIWQQVWVLNGKKSGDVSGRGIKFHFGYSTPRQWTDGCFVISSDYTKQGGKIKFNQNETRAALRSFDRIMGATKIFDYSYPGKSYRLIGAEFMKPVLDYKLILKDGF